MALRCTVRRWSAVTAFVLLCAATTSAQDVVKVGATGISFVLPPGMIKQAGRPAPIVDAWRDGSGAMGLDVFAIPHASGNADASMREFQDWPGVGRSLIAGFGSSSTKAIGASLKATCSFSGVPVERDATRALMRVRVRVECATAPSPTVFHDELIQVLTVSEVVLVRIDSKAATDAEATRAADGVWRTLKSSRAARAAADAPVQPKNEPPSATPVRGGAGVHFTDYTLQRPARLLGEVVGAVIAALGFGALLSLLFMRAGLVPLLALIAGQLVLISIRLWSSHYDDTWEINWLLLLPPPAIAIFTLRNWARRKWHASHSPVAAA